MGAVLSTFYVDYTANFSYKMPLDDSSDEDDDLFTPVLSRVGIEIITISSNESDTE